MCSLSLTDMGSMIPDQRITGSLWCLDLGSIQNQSGVDIDHSETDVGSILDGFWNEFGLNLETR